MSIDLLSSLIVACDDIISELSKELDLIETKKGLTYKQMQQIVFQADKTIKDNLYAILETLNHVP